MSNLDDSLLHDFNNNMKYFHSHIHQLEDQNKITPKNYKKKS